ncbi:putative bifunctional diguanylate cyclase/phosphodiesterase [Brucellaceae bacterium C25G]
MAASRRTDIPEDVRLSFLQSLYGHRTTLWFGLVAHMVGCGVIFLKTRDTAYLWFGLCFFVVTMGRLLDMSRFDRAKTSSMTHSQLNHWEGRYLVGASLVCLLLGLVCFYSTYVAKDSFAELTSLAILMGSVASIVGRNYPSAAAVMLMSISAITPVLLGFFLGGSRFQMIAGLLLVPYFLTNIQMANGLRRFLFEAFMGKHSLSVIAGRFDAALNNMPQGLIMFEADKTISVINDRAIEMLRIADGTRIQGRSIETVLRYCSREGVFPHNDFRNVSARIDDILAGLRKRDIFQFSNNRYVECIGNLREDGGPVLILDDVTQRVEAEAQIQHMARYDSLTGLPNRSYFDTMVRGLKAQNSKATLSGLIVIDINHFKHVNDTLGHYAGDQLLRLFAVRLGELDTKRFVSSRFGGDEFVVYVANLNEHAEIENIIDLIVENVTGSYNLDAAQVLVNVNMGIAISEDGRCDVSDMHIRADLALYEAKLNENKKWAIFEEAMDVKYRGRQRMKVQLREAVQNGTLSVVYQPIVSAHSLRVVACEALSRWDHPELGSVSPAEYIPLAEEMGIITDITRFMLNQACLDCAKWGGEVGVSVNLSAIDLANSNIAQIISDALSNAKLPPHLLEVEVTESAIINDGYNTSLVLQTLKNEGINIALDDFGTGYSSLSYLNSLPLTKVKVDRSFVRNIVEDRRSLMLLRGVTHLSHELGLGVTVEGVETEEQLALVRIAAGADLIQGYLMGKPMSVTSVRDYIGRSILSSAGTVLPSKSN